MLVTHHLTRADLEALAEIMHIRESINQRRITDAEIIRWATITGLRHELETMRMVAEAYQRTEEKADADHPRAACPAWAAPGR